MADGDSVLRAMTDDGAFRVITVRTTNTVRGAIAAQRGTGRTARYFGDLLTGAILFRETMAPQLRVQGIVKASKGRGSLVADSHPSGMTRGLIQLPRGATELDLGAGTVMQVMRTLPNGRIIQGVVLAGFGAFLLYLFYVAYPELAGQLPFWARIGAPVLFLTIGLFWLLRMRGYRIPLDPNKLEYQNGSETTILTREEILGYREYRTHRRRHRHFVTIVPRDSSRKTIQFRILFQADDYFFNWIRSLDSASFETITPPTMSLCPFRYLVVLCTTRCAPSSRGRWK